MRLRLGIALTIRKRINLLDAFRKSNGVRRCDIPHSTLPATLTVACRLVVVVWAPIFPTTFRKNLQVAIFALIAKTPGGRSQGSAKDACTCLTSSI